MWIVITPCVWIPWSHIVQHLGHTKRRCYLIAKIIMVLTSLDWLKWPHPHSWFLRTHLLFIFPLSIHQKKRAAHWPHGRYQHNLPFCLMDFKYVYGACLYYMYALVAYNGRSPDVSQNIWDSITVCYRRMKVYDEEEDFWLGVVHFQYSVDYLLN